MCTIVNQNISYYYMHLQSRRRIEASPRMLCRGVSRAVRCTFADVGAVVISGWSSAFSSNRDDQAKLIKKVIVVNEVDIEEKFVRGSGPGGQKINKSRNRVQLTHTSGVSVSVQEARCFAQCQYESNLADATYLTEIYRPIEKSPESCCAIN